MKLSSEKLDSVLEQIDLRLFLTITRRFRSSGSYLATTRSSLTTAASQ
jgi:hypothetical protein